MRCYIKHSEECFIRTLKHVEVVKKLGLRPRFSTNLSGFGYPDETLFLVFDLLHLNPEKCVEKTRRSRVFLTHFEAFGYVMKYSFECFILHLKQIRILGENWEESWVNLCNFFLTNPNSISGLISFVFILWIINEF